MMERFRALPRGEGRVCLELAEGIAQLTFDNPTRHNAMSPGMMLDLEAAVERLSGWSGVSLILRGQPPGSFCAGGDLVSVRQHLLEPGLGEAMCAFMQDQLGRLGALPILIVAAVEGAALGGGAELLTTCDLVIAGEGATIGFVQAALGVSPGWGGGSRLVERVGKRRAIRILAEARRMRAGEAREIGLVDRVVPEGDALEAALECCAPLLSHPAAAVRGAIRVARAADPLIERSVFATLWGGPSHLAALASGRRDPST